ncbi:MAG: dockerin type I repeat-containing protein [Acidobacteria bacterium]|nr:dockerin type I repeat-containing protein [Acidobacteriota bacterium]
MGKSCFFSLLFVVAILALGMTADAAVFLVSNTNDSGVGSLRDALNQANAAPGADTIVFMIPAPPYIIFPLSQLPPLTDPAGVLIDGYSQPGSNPGASPPSTAVPLIELDGISAGGVHGFWIKTPNNTIQGLIINNFEQDGIHIEATPYPTSNNIIWANFIGTDSSGTIRKGNGRNMASLWAGVTIAGSFDTPGVAMDNHVRGNLISANYAEGVSIMSLAGNDVFGNWVEMGNYIGTDITGLVDLGNDHDGVYLGEGTHDNVVCDNLISGNDFEGVSIVGYPEDVISTYSNIVQSNIIGLKQDLTPLPNTLCGVAIGRYGPAYFGGFAPNNQVLTNTIAHNGRNGVTVWEHASTPSNADGNRISQNAIYDNGILGIDLDDDGVTVNDPNDPDSGANQDENYPVITIADYCAGTTAVSGTVDIDTDPTLAVVEIFLALPDPSGYGEGAVFLGQAVPATGGSWQFTCFRQLVPGDLVTATCTDLNGNTSEFAQYITVVLLSTCGDLNGDGNTDAQDALDLANYLAGAAIIFAGNADLNLDGVIDAVDLALLMQVLAGNL